MIYWDLKTKEMIDDTDKSIFYYMTASVVEVDKYLHPTGNAAFIVPLLVTDDGLHFNFNHPTT